MTDAERIDELEQQLGRLHLLIQTVSRLMVEKGVCTEEELVDMALVIDAEDGVADGRVTPRPRPTRSRRVRH